MQSNQSQRVSKYLLFLITSCMGYLNYSGLGPKKQDLWPKINVQSSGVLRRPQNLSDSKKANVLCDCNHDMTVCQKVPKADFSKLIFKVKIHPNLFIIFFN